MVGVDLLAFGWPIPSSALVGVSQGHHVVDVQVPGVRDGDGGVGCKPLAGFDSALSIGLESGRDEAFRDQHFLPGVLAVPVVIVQCFQSARPYWGRLTGMEAMVTCKVAGWGPAMGFGSDVGGAVDAAWGMAAAVAGVGDSGAAVAPD